MLDVPVAVKKALKKGIYKKDLRINVLKADGVTSDFMIENDNIVAESLNIDERMCSSDELKFGLCEGASLEFQYFGKPNINGKTLKVFIRVYYKNSGGTMSNYSIPMGYFTVDSCPMQASTGIYKATCYNKLQSKYLDAKANELLIDAYNNQDSYSPSTIEKLLDIALSDYKIDTHSTLKPRLSHELTSKSRLGYCPTIDLEVYELNGQVAETHYLHAVCPFVLGRFTNNSTMYKIAEFYKSMVSYYVNTYSGAYTGRPYEDYKTVSDDEPFYDWLMDSGSNVSEIRGGVYVYNYTDANNTAHTVSNFVIPSGSEFPTPYYWKINTLTTSAGSSYQVGFYLPVYWVMDDNPTYTWTGVSTSVFTEIRRRMDAVVYDMNDLCWEVWKQKTSVASSMSVGSEIEDWPDVTLRELQSAIYELSCQYGQLDRQTDEFFGVELNGGGLYPAENLYPANSLYPNSNTGGIGFHPYPSEYSQLWTDTQGEQTFRYLIITYKGLDENNQEVDKVLQRTVNANGTTDYNMSDNWLFRNLVWADADVGDYADAMVSKMQGIKWFPFEMWLAGLPYVETGDAVEITDREGNTHTSYVLQRQLKGIQNLEDTYINGELDIF